MIHGRILVCALESDLHDIAPGTVKLVVQACEVSIKNIGQQKSHKVKYFVIKLFRNMMLAFLKRLYLSMYVHV